MVVSVLREEAALKLEKRRQQLDKKRKELRKWEDLHAAGPVTAQLSSRFSK